MDIVKAVRYGLLVKMAESIHPADLKNIADTKISIQYEGEPVEYDVISTIYGNDIVTDMNPECADIVSYGFILQGIDGEVVIAIRGTDGILEWIHDADFLKVNSWFGNTDDGFMSIYNSLSVDPADFDVRVASTLMSLTFPRPVSRVTVCGHSLGGALATLLAFELAVKTPALSLSVYTYASPRVGDSDFATRYNLAVPDTNRIASRADIVPKLPPPLLYTHVNSLFELTTISLDPPRLLVRPEIASEHHMTTYLYLLSRLAGGQVLPLDLSATPLI